MLQYLIVPLSRDAVSFCHYRIPDSNEKEVISSEILKEAITWAMKENLTVQFVYPSYELDIKILELINTIDHADIVPYDAPNNIRKFADIIVFDNIDDLSEFGLRKNQAYVLRTSMDELLNSAKAIRQVLPILDRLNIVITDVKGLSEDILDKYRYWLEDLIPILIQEYRIGHAIQLNLLTDRLMLNEMNNCDAGESTITLGTDGKFYICPGFYHDGIRSVGDLKTGLNIKNPQLYRLDHAPVCRNCDSYQCKRCVWLNSHLTLEVNTPGREQCLISHIERNASRKLKEELLKYISGTPKYVDIPEIDYLDPFEKLCNTQKHSI